MDNAAAGWLKGNGPTDRKEKANVESAFNMGWLGKKMPSWMSEANEPDHPKWKKRQKKGFDADGDGKTNEPMPAKLKAALKKKGKVDESQIDSLEKLIGKRVTGEGRYSIDGLPFDLIDAGGGDVGLRATDKDAATDLLIRLRVARIKTRFDKRRGVIFIESDATDFAGPQWTKRDVATIDQLRALLGE